jgi:hypothetical protein
MGEFDSPATDKSEANRHDDDGKAKYSELLFEAVCMGTGSALVNTTLTLRPARVSVPAGLRGHSPAWNMKSLG